MPLPRTLALRPHPTTPCPALDSVAASVEASADGGLALRYRILGDAGRLRLPAPCPPGPADGLWQHTCCEAFIADAGGEAYREFNFAPSGQWAVFDFTAYRQRNADFRPAAAPCIVLAPQADGFALDAFLPAALLPAAARLVLGLTAVIETTDGARHYWALDHAAPQPDFHLRQSFALALNRNAP